MKKIKQAILGSPKTSILGICTAILTVLQFYNVISTQESVLWIGVLGALLGLSAKDGDKSGTKINNFEGPGGMEPDEGYAKQNQNK